MNLTSLVPPTALRDYAKGRGWVLRREVTKQRTYVMTNPAFAGRQLVFPMDTTAPDYSEVVALISEKLADMENRSPEAILKNLLEVGDDAISFRVTNASTDDFLPLAFAGSMVVGAQELLLASACTVLKPQTRHLRLSRVEARELLETAKFRHTQPGSFILNVSCPVDGLDVQAPLLPEECDAPFVRRTTMTLCRSLRELVSSIETDALDTFVDGLKKSTSPTVSSNLCEALSRFEDQKLKNSVEIGVSWAATIPRPLDEGFISSVRIQHDYFARIGEIARELRSNEQHQDDTFPGTVERLDGEMGEDGKRSGEVILSLLTPDGEQVRARAQLTADQYVQADAAHMRDRAFVQVTGRLYPGRQPRVLSDIKSFSLMRSEHDAA